MESSSSMTSTTGWSATPECYRPPVEWTEPPAIDPREGGSRAAAGQDARRSSPNDCTWPDSSFPVSRC